MLIQGTNIPIQVTFDSEVLSFPKIFATLWQGGKQIKQWQKSDMSIMGETVTLPLSEQETKKFKKGKVQLDIKGLNALGQTVFWEEAVIEVIDRKDRNIEMTAGG